MFCSRKYISFILYKKILDSLFMVSFFAKDQKISTDDLKDIIELIEKGKEN